MDVLQALKRTGKARSVVLIALVFAGLGGIYWMSFAQSSSDWRTYENPEQHYRVRYPSSWHVSVEPSLCGADGFCVQYTTFASEAFQARVAVNFQGGFCESSASISNKNIEVSRHAGEEIVCRGSALAGTGADGIYSIARIFKDVDGKNYVVQGGNTLPGDRLPDTADLDMLVRSFRFTY